MLIVTLLIYLLIPVLIIYLSDKSRIINRIGAVILAYTLGLILGHCGIIPKPGAYLDSILSLQHDFSQPELEKLFFDGKISEKDLDAYRFIKLQNLLTMITIPLALPLLLFSLKVKTWFRMAGKTLVSMFLALISVVVVISFGFIVFKEHLEEANKMAGLLVGVYSGGTPNLGSLKMMLEVSADTYIKTHTYDTLVSLVYLVFLITIGKNLFRKILSPYPQLENKELYDSFTFTEHAYSGFFKPQVLKGLGLALLIAVVIFGIGGVLSLFVSENSVMITVILAITTLSILVSLIPRVNKIEKTFELGMYFIIVFSMVVASMADVNKLLNISSYLFYYISLVVFGSLVLHAFLSKLFKVDADTLMVTSTALICSPPFVPLVAGSLRNKEVIVSGLTVGIIGYAIGNYLGVLIASLLG